MATVQPFPFEGSAGSELAGLLHRPEGEVRGVVLMAHCFTCSKDLPVSARLARGLAGRGYVVLRFDFTGLGESEGDFASTTVSSNVTDLTRAALAMLRKGYPPTGLIGHSMGGAAVLLAAERMKTVRAVAVINTPFDVGTVTRHFGDRLGVIEAEGEAEVTLAGRPYTIRKAFLDDLSSHPDGEHIAALGRPLLVVHAVGDRTVDVAEGERIFATAAQPKAFWPLVDSDHLISDRGQVEELAEVLAGWLDRTTGPGATDGGEQG